MDKTIVNRENDLLAAVWREKGYLDNRSLEDNLSRLPSAETISRMRRQLHQEGLIEYSKEADARRESEYQRHLDEYSSHYTYRYNFNDKKPKRPRLFRRMK